MRVIVHVDLDCFYAQVEQRRLGLDGDVDAVAVQQWSNLIAVNYVARRHGVKRGMPAHEAQKLCPGLRCVHVETIGEGGVVVEDPTPPAPGATRDPMVKASLRRYRGASREVFAALAAHCDLVERASIDEAFLDVTAQSAALLKEAQAAAAAAGRSAGHGDGVGEVHSNDGREEEGTGGHEDGAGVAGASGDAPDPDGEGVAAGQQQHQCKPKDYRRELDFRTQRHSQVVDAEHDATATELSQSQEAAAAAAPELTESARLLLAGGVVVDRIRRAVREATGFTVSAGIAANRVVAKLASARNKPNKQTIVPLSLQSAMMRSIPFREVRGFGGKYGSALEAALSAKDGDGGGADVVTRRVRNGWHDPKAADDAPPLTCGDLLDVFGGTDGTKRFAQRCSIPLDAATAVMRSVAGEGMDEVKPNLKPKSLSACKSAYLGDAAMVRRCMAVLAEELVERMAEDELLWRRRATTLVVHHRGALKKDHLSKWKAGKTSELTRDRNRQCRMPLGAEATVEASNSQGETARKTVRVPTPGQIVETAEGMLRKLASSGGLPVLPCTRIALCATDLQDLETGSASLTSFFQAQPKGSVNSSGGGTSLRSPQRKRPKRKRGTLEGFFGGAAKKPAPTTEVVGEAHTTIEDAKAEIPRAEGEGQGAGPLAGSFGAAVTEEPAPAPASPQRNEMWGGDEETDIRSAEREGDGVGDGHGEEVEEGQGQDNVIAPSELEDKDRQGQGVYVLVVEDEPPDPVVDSTDAEVEPEPEAAGAPAQAPAEATATTSLDGGMKACPRCGQEMPAEELPEHEDWHVAMDLQERFHPGSSGSARRAPGGLSGIQPRQWSKQRAPQSKIQSFFKR
uniref:DNA polymerase eta n=1 Tax=Phaeomonas parva TaxID=124430 RepID=A0A7S1TNC7_9STRA|mmetsp:Transcript_10504/g.31664  ORF Transcript_10504/g.31664 Transcript_10504/m.31664 type:complete len:852 (+) Transcript_10504:95-2650(+)